MSQHWHAHWAEDGFKPTRLQNWEVPRWHPEWPTKHCTTTKFEAHTNGRVFIDFKKPKNPWSNFKDSWELPLKIDRKTAEKLSKSTEYNKPVWNYYKKKREFECRGQCKAVTSAKKDTKADTNGKEKKIEKLEKPSGNEENIECINKTFKGTVVEACKL